MNLKYIIILVSTGLVLSETVDLNKHENLVQKKYFADLNPFVVGGKYASDGQFPHQVALFRHTKFSCSGSIIGRRHVLTAAHCVYGSDGLISTSNLTILAGTNKLYEDGTFYEIEAIHPHLEYGDFKNDVALLKIVNQFEFDNYTKPIILNRHLLSPNADIELSGWGRTGTVEDISLDLKFTTSHYIKQTECETVTGISHPGIICLQAVGTDGVCFGDSGGPATYNGRLIGVANFIVDSCGTLKPDGFASVSYFYDWIVHHMSL